MGDGGGEQWAGPGGSPEEGHPASHLAFCQDYSKSLGDRTGKIAWAGEILLPPAQERSIYNIKE